MDTAYVFESMLFVHGSFATICNVKTVSYQLLNNGVTTLSGTQSFAPPVVTGR